MATTLKATTLATLAAILVGVGLTATPAQAVSCPGGYICFYNNPDGTVLLDQILVSSIQRSVCRRLPTTATNRTSYIANRSSSAFNVYDGGYCSDAPGYIGPNTSGRMTGIWDGTISSYYKQ